MRLSIFILWLYVGCAVIAQERYLCQLPNGEIKTYDLQTHNCTWEGLIPLKTVPTTSSTTTTEATTTTTTTEVTTTTTTPLPVRIKARCVKPAPYMNCTGQRLCGGFQCCGPSQSYHPDFSTCCQIMKTKVEIHDNKPEKDHVCCGLDVFERGKQTCLHAASNDALWNPKKYKELRQSRNCFLYAYIIMGYSIESDQATITLKQIQPNKGILTKQVALDKYSPRRSLKPAKHLLLTDQDRSEMIDFYTYSDDEVYALKSKIQKKFLKGNKRVSRKINRRLRKNCSPKRSKRTKHQRGGRKNLNRLVRRKRFLATSHLHKS